MTLAHRERKRRRLQLPLGGDEIIPQMQLSNTQVDYRRTFRRQVLNLGVSLLICLVCVLAMEVPWLDPTAGTGRFFGTLFMVMWCSGLLILSLRIVRQHHSQFSLRTLMLITTIVAILLGVGRILGVHVAALTFMFLASSVMLWDSWLRKSEWHARWNSLSGRFLTFVEALAAVFGLAHVSRGAFYILFWTKYFGAQ